MSNFYIKSRDKYLPVDVRSILPSGLDNHLVIVRVGTDEYPASIADLDATEESFSNADILKDLNNVSIIITPYQIDVGAINKDDIGEKQIYLQIKSGSDVGMLDKEIKEIYKKYNKKLNVVVLPTPLKVKEYREVKDILNRAAIRRVRRSRSKG